VRFLDAQPEALVGGLASVLSALLYDDEHRGRALAMLEPERARLGEHWIAAAAGDTAVTELGLDLVALTARDLVGAA
jgi:hypothetical protein